MPDIFDQIAPESKGDIFDQISPSKRTPADENAQMSDAKWGAQNPVLRALQNTGEQAFVNPAYQAAKVIAPAVTGIEKGVGYSPTNPAFNKLSGFAHPDMSSAPFAAKVLGDVAGGASQGLAASAAGGGNPLIGYGVISGLGAFGRGESPLPAAVGGAASAIPQMVAGKVGSSLASGATKAIGGAVSRLAPRIGTALGMGGASAAQAQMQGQNPIEAAASGAAFGLMSPMNPIGAPRQLTPEQHSDLLDQGAAIYRHVLNPGKGIINKVEMKSGGDIDDSMRLAAKEGIVINSKEGKLDAAGAIAHLKASVAPMYDMQNKILSDNPAKQFNLNDIGDKVKSSLTDKIKNASELQASKDKVDNEISAEILRHGESVDGQTLNMIKQGMWSKSYNPLEPNANDSARAIGFAAKDAIEKAYPDESIKENNAKIGQYLQLQKILEKSHGQVVQAGKIGKYVAGSIGGGTGALIGAHVPVLGEIAGPVVGFKVGEKINQIMNSPERITGGWANKIKNVKVNDGKALEPQIMNKPNAGSVNPVLGISKINSAGLPSPKTVGGQVNKSGPGKYGAWGGAISMPNIKGEGAIEAGAPENKYQPGPEAIITPKPESEEHAKTFPQSSVNPLANAQQGSANDPLGKKAITAGIVAGAIGLGSVFNPINSQAAQVKDPKRLKLSTNQYIMNNEGWKGMPYLDTTGHKTVGYGFNMSGPAAKYIPLAVRQNRRPLTKEEGMEIFNKVYPNAVEAAQKFAGESWGNLSANQQKALIDMHYQMGSLGFPKLKAALQSGNYNTAAKEILNSKYATKDAPNRALQNAVLMQS